MHDHLLAVDAGFGQLLARQSHSLWVLVQDDDEELRPPGNLEGQLAGAGAQHQAETLVDVGLRKRRSGRVGQDRIVAIGSRCFRLMVSRHCVFTGPETVCPASIGADKEYPISDGQPKGSAFDSLFPERTAGGRVYRQDDVIAAREERSIDQQERLQFVVVPAGPDRHLLQLFEELLVFLQQQAGRSDSPWSLSRTGVVRVLRGGMTILQCQFAELLQVDGEGLFASQQVNALVGCHAPPF